MTQATTTSTSTEVSTTSNKAKPAPTPIEAISKITKVLDQLSPIDRKRVLAFVNEGADESQGS